MSMLSEKPFLRGHFHQAAFFAALGACAMLIARGHSARVLIAAVIYSISLSAMFGVSALYHRPRWSAAQRLWMKRIDHATIFVLIAGTGTPLALLSLPPEEGFRLLLTMWAASAVGILRSLFWVGAPKWFSASLYIAVGWIYGSYVGELGRALGDYYLTLLVLGGVVYTLGAVIYAMKRPDPSPKYFGYHEIFHALVIVAAILHFMVIQSVII